MSAYGSDERPDAQENPPNQNFWFANQTHEATMSKREPPSGFDALFALIFLALVAAGSWWFLSMTNTVFADALLAHMVALMRGRG